MPQWVSWDQTGAVGLKSGHNWVNPGHMGHLGHVEGSVGHVGPMGHVGHWTSEFVQKAIGATGFYHMGLMGY